MNKKQKRLGNKGFSLVELIVVIAIMAVLVAVLAPTLISKIEDSRVSSDLSTVTEIKTQVTNMLANEEIYNELVDTSTKEYTLSDDLDFAGDKTDYPKADKEIQNVLEKFEFQSKDAKDKKEVIIKINSKGKVYVFVEDGDTNAPIDIDGKKLEAGNPL